MHDLHSRSYNGTLSKGQELNGIWMNRRYTEATETLWEHLFVTINICDKKRICEKW